MADDARLQEAAADGYERRDLSPRAIAMFALGLAGVIAIVVAVVTAFQWFDAKQYQRRQPPRPRVAVTPEATGPQLQVNAPAELRTMREAEERTLSSYGWVDPQSDAVRIPIDRAIEILAQKGLPARQEDKAKSKK